MKITVALTALQTVDAASRQMIREAVFGKNPPILKVPRILYDDEFDFQLQTTTLSREDLVIAGVAPNKAIYLSKQQDNRWFEISDAGAYIDVSVTGDAKDLWALDYKKDLAHIKNTSWEGFEKLSGQMSMKKISATTDNRVLVGLGSSDGQVYNRNGVDGVWKKNRPIYETAISVGVSGDSQIVYAVSTVGHLLYQKGFNGNWILDSGPSMADIALTLKGEHLVAVGKSDQKVYYCDNFPCGNKWVKDTQSNSFTQASVAEDYAYVYGCSPRNDIFLKQTGVMQNPSIARWETVGPSNNLQLTGSLNNTLGKDDNHQLRGSLN